MTDDLFLGVDGGKSKTVCLVATRDGTVVGAGRAGNADHSTIPLPVALDSVGSAVTEALSSVGAAPASVAIGTFGLAGAVWPEDFLELADGLRQRQLSRQVIVLNDAQVALRGASAGQPGIVVSAGTHLSVALRTPGDDEWFSGWSSVDGPGGAELGRRVVWAIIHAFDGRGPKTALTEAVADATGADAEGLLRIIARGDLSEGLTASLAPILFQVHGSTDDIVAGSIIADAGREMARWIPGLRRRFPSDGGIDVYLAGGLFHASDSRLEQVFRSSVRTSTPDARIHGSVMEPVVGALLQSLQAGDIPADAPLLARIASTGPPAAFYATDQAQVHRPTHG